MVTEVVQYLLIMEQKKFPVKKQEITKLLNLKGNSLKTFKSVLSASDKYLEEVFPIQDILFLSDQPHL